MRPQRNTKSMKKKISKINNDITYIETIKKQ